MDIPNCMPEYWIALTKYENTKSWYVLAYALFKYMDIMLPIFQYLQYSLFSKKLLK